MKNYTLFSLVLASIFLFSCKKQYSCQCATTITSPGYNPYTVSSLTQIDTRTTKKRAETICSHSEKQLQKNTIDYKNGSETVTTSCAIKTKQ
jgi:hypothetical protein